MKIVIFVDYSNKEFNKDFQLSNMLIAKGHNVFFAINDEQFIDLKNKCDMLFLGLSAINKQSEYDYIAILSDKIINEL